MYYDSHHKYPSSEKTAFGITDSIADFVSKHYWACFVVIVIICFSVLVVFKPEKWYLWIVASPIFVWTITPLLLVFAGVEWMVWSIITKLRKFKNRAMTDTRFKWLCTCVTVATIVIAAMVAYSWNNPRKHEPKSDSTGEYVYVDRMGIVHADRKCSRLNYKGMTSRRIKIAECEVDENSMCPKCVDDRTYERLCEMGGLKQ